MEEAGELTRMHLTSRLCIQLRSAEETRWIQSHLVPHLESMGCPGNGGYKTSALLLLTYLFFISNYPILWNSPLISFMSCPFLFSPRLSFWFFSWPLLSFSLSSPFPITLLFSICHLLFFLSCTLLSLISSSSYTRLFYPVKSNITIPQKNIICIYCERRVMAFKTCFRLVNVWANKLI